ncbi:MAG: LysR family transcriptional regulator [Burkholderiaceae bacterium]
MIDMQKPDAGKVAARLTDLNLLRMLQALLRTRSVTRGGELLGLSQPAASRTMSKLREVFGDPLLVRTSKGYALTSLAESLGPSVECALAAADEVFFAAAFEPDASTRAFRVCATDYGALAVVAPFSSGLLSEAPGISLLVSSWTDDTIEALEQGNLDVALYADDRIPPDFHYRDLFRETYVVIARRGHSLCKARGKTLPRFLAMLAEHRQIMARFPSGRVYATDDVLARLGAPSHKVGVAIPYFNTAPLIVAESDLVMVLPKKVAERFSGMLPLEIIPIPTRQEDFTYRLIWHERVHRDPGVTWLREKLVQSVRKPRAG